ncbi:MAG: hypothetical protein LBM96_09445 [Methanobrevibacter sp.]|jgi:hypothetical protein|nr:hypothetical protein [Candidatus Methanoflexus mossambicus]
MENEYYLCGGDIIVETAAMRTILKMFPEERNEWEKEFEKEDPDEWKRFKEDNEDLFE